jgi:hypothetical protein
MSALQSLAVRSLLPLLVASGPGVISACAADMSTPGAADDDGAGSSDGDDGDGGDGADKSDSADDGAPDDGADDGADGADDGAGPDASGAGDAAILDAAILDAAILDAALPDAGPPPPEGPYELLSESGLYSDIATHTIATDVMEFEPEFKLWSDGAEKQRWIRLPPGDQINTSLMDRWRFPPGTTVWKEFRDPVTDKRLETRIIQKLANGDHYFASFIWNDDDTEAVFDPTLFPAPERDIPAGCSECASPPCTFPPSCHVVPQSNRCLQCHGGEIGRLLGFSAVQLSHGGEGLTLTSLAEAGMLSDPPPDGQTFPVPGTPVERAAIGYLHANCGHCHSPQQGNNICFSETGLATRVLPGADTVEETALYQSAVGQPLTYWINAMRGNHTDQTTGELITQRIVPGDPSRSAIFYRMGVREFGQPAPFDDHQQMPFFATNEVDEAGLAQVELWINSLP